MEEKKRLLKLNILCYINNFLYIVVSSKIVIEDMSTIWILTPFIFMFLTSFILENKYHNERLYMKKECYVDYAVRFIGCCVAFTEFGLALYIKLILCSVTLIINLIIEFKIIKLKPNGERDISKTILEDKININNAYDGITIGIITGIKISCFYGLMMVFSLKFLYVSIAMVIVVFIVFCKIEFNRVFMSYKSREDAKKIYLRSVVSFGIGTTIWIIQKLFFQGDAGSNAVNFVIVISLLPSFLNTRSIGIILRRNSERK